MKVTYEGLLENRPAFGRIQAIVNPVKLFDARQGDTAPDTKFPSPCLTIFFTFFSRKPS